MIETDIRNMILEEVDIPVIVGKAFQISGDYITIERVSGGGRYTLESLLNTKINVYQISIFTKTLFKAKTIAKDLYTMDTKGDVNHFHIRNEQDYYSQEKELNGVILDVEVFSQ